MFEDLPFLILIGTLLLLAFFAAAWPMDRF
jgi:hypothetical protein